MDDVTEKKQLFENDYVTVNVWTSEDNSAISGANVGHVSIETRYDYISLWPGARGERKNKDPGFFQKMESQRNRYFSMRPPSFKQNYEMDCFLEAASEGQIRQINHIKQCQPNEIPYLLNTEDMTFETLDSQPKAIEENKQLIAVKPCYANVRLVLYSLSIDKISQSFNNMQKNIPGWTLIGSNMFSRLTSDPAENCASLAYRLLKEGGMYAGLNSTLSSQTSSVVTPDSLLRHVVAAKEKENEKYPQTKQWFRPGESSLDEVKRAYLEVGKNANANEDSIFSSFQKSPDEEKCRIS